MAMYWRDHQQMKHKPRTRLAIAAASAATLLGVVVSAPAAFAYDSMSGSRNCGSSYMSLTTVDTGAWAEHRKYDANGPSVKAWGYSSSTVHRSGWGTGVQQWFAHAGTNVHSASTTCIAPAL